MTDQLSAPADLEELRAVAENAPQTEWEVEYDEDVVDTDFGPIVRWPWRIPAVCNFTEEMAENVAHEPIATFIATFDPPTVLALLSEIESLRSDRERTLFKPQPPHRPKPAGQDYPWPHHPGCTYLLSTGLEWCDCHDMEAEARLTHLERIADAARAVVEAKKRVHFNTQNGIIYEVDELTKADEALAAALNQEAPDGD